MTTTDSRGAEVPGSQKNLRVVGMSGSLRRDSYNRKLLRLAMAVAAETGAEAKEVDLQEISLPNYNEDLVVGNVPDAVRRIREEFSAADVILIASPEYNYSIPGGLKNALDWLSRGEKPLTGKTAAIFGASAGPFGTIRMQPHLRQVLEAMNMLMVSQPQVMIRSAKDAFTSEGQLIDPKVHVQLATLVRKTMALAKSLRSGADSTPLP